MQRLLAKPAPSDDLTDHEVIGLAARAKRKQGNVAELTGASLFPGAELSRVSRLLYVNLSARAETETWTPLWGHDSVPGTRDGKPGPESASRSLVDRLARAAAHANAL